MKKFAFITGALSIELVSVGVLYKIIERSAPEAETTAPYLLIGLGIGVFALFFIPSSFKYMYDRKN